jgi:hypothetical protein
LLFGPLSEMIGKIMERLQKIACLVDSGDGVRHNRPAGLMTPLLTVRVPDMTAQKIKYYCLR